MNYSTFMVHLDLSAPNENLLRVTADLAQRFEARVVGVAACQPMRITDSQSYVSGDLVEADRAEIEKETNEAEARFRAVLQGRVSSLEWRSAVSIVALAEYVAQQARIADLLVTAPDRGWSRIDSSRHVGVGDLVMRVGRPVLIVPPEVDRLSSDSVVIGWKDTRETRRAVVDALPLLKQAGRVTVVEIAADAEMAAARAHLADVVEWLRRHDVAAEALAVPATGNDGARLHAIAEEKGAGVLVAGAYGHNRLREWVLGGVTHDLLLRPARCSLVPH